MAQPTNLGRIPERVTVRLIRTDPFQCVLTRYDSPVGTAGRAAIDWTDAPTLEFPDAAVDPWVSTLDANEATFDVPEADVTALIATGHRTVKLTVGGLVWATGSWIAAG